MKKRYILLATISFGLLAQDSFLNNQTEKRSNNMINIGISEKNRQEIANTLNKLLANEFVLYTKTLKYHWNVTGKLFGPLHSFFGDQYAQLLECIDATAERIRTIGFIPYGTLQEFSSHATLKEEPNINPNDTGMIKNLLEDHETIIQELRNFIDLSSKLNDMGTNNFLSDLLEKHEKMAWMLRAHLG